MRAAFVLAAALSAVVLSGCDKDAQADQTTAAPAAAAVAAAATADAAVTPGRTVTSTSV